MHSLVSNYYLISRFDSIVFTLFLSDIYRIERCTQIQTVLRPLLKDDKNHFATVEFYNDDEFSKLSQKIPKEDNESNADFQKRLTSIKEKRKMLVKDNNFIQHKKASNQNECNEIIQELHEYIAKPLYLSIVKQVIIHTDKLPGN